MHHLPIVVYQERWGEIKKKVVFHSIYIERGSRASENKRDRIKINIHKKN